jgi:hypothetical protein
MPTASPGARTPNRAVRNPCFCFATQPPSADTVCNNSSQSADKDLFTQLHRRCRRSDALAAPSIVSAQGTYPTKPVRCINPFPAGGATDTLSRLRPLTVKS